MEIPLLCSKQSKVSNSQLGLLFTGNLNAECFYYLGNFIQLSTIRLNKSHRHFLANSIRDRLVIQSSCSVVDQYDLMRAAPNIFGRSLLAF